MVLPRRAALRDVIFSAEERTVIYATRPFNADSEALAVKLNVEGHPPESVRETLRARQLQRFLDADDVRSLLDVQHDVEIGEEQLIDLVLHYADAHEYPPWFFELATKE